MDNRQNKIQHLYHRAAFGISIDELKNVKGDAPKNWVEKLFTDSEKIVPLQLVDDNLSKADFKAKDKEEQKELNRKYKDIARSVNVGWLQRLPVDEAGLREKMTFFWHNHFACITKNIVFGQRYINIIRENALGNFKTLATEVSKSAAMLAFLNNQQNFKSKPNENFARELMELFTIGRGNYSENDVKAAARSFTGWRFTGNGNFEFRPVLHDSEEKTFMGHSGNFDGNDIIRIILSRRETAYNISKKIYRYFVNDIPDEKNIQSMTDVFFQSDYNITKLMKFMLTSEWFYAKENIGSHVKSPIELLVDLMKKFSIQFNEPDKLWILENTMRQVLFFPPNVAGWPVGRGWIDSSMLMFRLKLPSALLNAGIIDMDDSRDASMDDPDMKIIMRQSEKIKQRFNTTVNWEIFNQTFANKNIGAMKIELWNYLLQQPLDESRFQNIFDSNDDTPKAIALKLISLPEFQLS